jgi:hypothetical protein
MASFRPFFEIPSDAPSEKPPVDFTGIFGRL